MGGLKLQDEGLAMVQDVVAKHPLRALGPLLDAAMVGLRGSKFHPTASIGKHLKHKCPTPSPIATYLPSPTPGQSTSTDPLPLVIPDTATSSAQDIPSSQ